MCRCSRRCAHDYPFPARSASHNTAKKRFKLYRFGRLYITVAPVNCGHSPAAQQQNVGAYERTESALKNAPLACAAPILPVVHLTVSQQRQPLLKTIGIDAALGVLELQRHDLRTELSQSWFLVGTPVYEIVVINPN